MTDSNDNQQQSDGQEDSSDYKGPDRRQNDNGDGRRHEPARHGTGRRRAQGEV